MQKLALLLVLLFLAGRVGGCAGNNTTIRQLRESNERFLQEVESLRRDYESLAAVEKTLKDLKLRLDVLEGKITEEGEVTETIEEEEDATEEIEQLTARIEALEARVSVPSTPPEEQRAEPAQKRAQSPASTGPKKVSVFRPERYDVQQSYREALKDYRNHRYDHAIGEFTEILSMAPESSLADNAQYWVGECYYALNDYRAALTAFEKVFTYPESEKLDDAQLKIGYSYLKAGDREEAVAAFRKVLSTYPDSEYRRRAEAMIRSISEGK
jgi:tol-pal system protein YbgF